MIKVIDKAISRENQLKSTIKTYPNSPCQTGKARLGPPGSKCQSSDWTFAALPILSMPGGRIRRQTAFSGFATA